MTRMRAERLRRGWSLARLCAATGGIDPGALSRLERGVWRACGPSWRRRIAEALGLSEDELFQEVPANDVAKRV